MTFTKTGKKGLTTRSVLFYNRVIRNSRSCYRSYSFSAVRQLLSIIELTAYTLLLAAENTTEEVEE